MNKLIIILYLLIAYGSLFPFSFSPEVFSAEIGTWSQISVSGFGDTLGNILLFIPLGLLYRIEVVTKQKAIMAIQSWLLPFSLAITFALLLQLLQIGIIERDQNLFDVIFNAIGWIMGYLIVSVFDDKRLILSNPITLLPLSIVGVFIAAQLVPFVPSIDLQAMIDSVKPLLSLPNIQHSAEIIISVLYWLVMFRLLSYWRPISVASFFLGYVSFLVAKVIIYTNILSWSAFIAPIIAYLLYWLRDWHQPKALAQLHMLLLITYFVSNLISFSDTQVGNFSLLPFHSYLAGQLVTGVAALLTKLALFSAMLWIALELSYRLLKQAMILAILVLFSELSQLFIASRVFDLGDVLLVAIAYLLVRHIGDRLAQVAEQISIDNSRQSQETPNFRGTKQHLTISNNIIRIERNMRTFTIMCTLGFVVFYAAVKLLLALPNVPYNVLDMFRHYGNVVDILFFYLAGLSFLLGAFWAGSTANNAQGFAKFIPFRPMLVAIVSFSFLWLSISTETVFDFLGASVFVHRVIDREVLGSLFSQLFSAIGRENLQLIFAFVEPYVRFFAFAGPMLLFIAWFSLLMQLSSTRSSLSVIKVALPVLLGYLPWLILCKVIAFDWSSTDNLNELIARESGLGLAGGPFLYLLMMLIALTGVFVGFSFARAQIRKLLLPLVMLVLSIPVGWYLLMLGLEANFTKYGQTYSGIDFLLGPDRMNKLSQQALIIRWSILQLAATLVIAAACLCFLYHNQGIAYLQKLRISAVTQSKLPVGAFCAICSIMLAGYFTNDANQYRFVSSTKMVNKVSKYDGRDRKVANFILPKNPVPGTISVDGVKVKNLKTALAQAKDFSEIRLTAGHYQQAGVLTADHVTIIAEPGAVVFGKAAQNKGAIVVKGDFATIDGLECHSISVASKNGVCVRLEGEGIVLKNVYFHHAEGGLLGSSKGGDIVIKNSRFEYLGHGSFFHGIYTLEKTRLIIKNSHFLNTQNGGHEIKSRSYHTEISGSIIASNDTADSRLIDIANGGVVDIRDNILIEGVMSENDDLISWGVEGLVHTNNQITITDNLLISDKSLANLMSVRQRPDKVNITNNIVVGNINGIPYGSNDFYQSRAELGLKPAPYIPRLNQ